jgi:hypothetical protein
MSVHLGGYFLFIPGAKGRYPRLPSLVKSLFGARSTEILRNKKYTSVTNYNLGE